MHPRGPKDHDPGFNNPGGKPMAPAPGLIGSGGVGVNRLLPAPGGANNGVITPNLNHAAGIRPKDVSIINIR